MHPIGMATIIHLATSLVVTYAVHLAGRRKIVAIASDGQGWGWMLAYVACCVAGAAASVAVATVVVLLVTGGSPLGYRPLFLVTMGPMSLMIAVIMGVPTTLWRIPRINPDDKSRCACCRYNLTGNTSGRCPECGAPCEPVDGEAADRQEPDDE